MASTLTYVAVAGDYLVKIAEEHGTTWQAIWGHPGNAEHRAKRGSPDVLYPGDVLQIPVADRPSEPPPPPLVEPPPPPAPPPPQPQPKGVDPTWPYGELPGPLAKSEPRWTCPTGICACADTGGEHEMVVHTVFLHDDMSRRMAGARCRVHGVGVHEAPAYAAADGSLAIELHALPKTLVVEWAAEDVPLAGPFPFRRTYTLAPDGTTDEVVRARLDNLGFARAATLWEKVESFQRTYGLPVDGEAASVLPVLAEFHDLASLPPLVEVPDAERPGQVTRRPDPPLAPDLRPPSQGCLAAVEELGPRDCHFSFVMFDGRERAPLAHASYVIDDGSAVVHYGTTDAQGNLEHGDVPGGDYFLRIGGITMTVPAIHKDESLRPLLAIPDA
ncbi:MAG: LysM peptidoglycan-binding domain-containing protein [Myxococcales bacterium]|nr:LysM peptidoglycan-binding domain-containing protein [Myxococcales bacterium]